MLVLRFLLHLFDAGGGYQDHFLEKQPLADDQVFDLTLLIPKNMGYPRLAHIAFAQLMCGILNLHARLYLVQIRLLPFCTILIMLLSHNRGLS